MIEDGLLKAPVLRLRVQVTIESLVYPAAYRLVPSGERATLHGPLRLTVPSLLVMDEAVVLLRYPSPVKWDTAGPHGQASTPTKGKDTRRR